MGSYHRVFEALAGVFAVATLPAGIAAYMNTGPQAALWVFVVGWLFLVPVAGVLAGSLADPAEEIERARKLRDLAVGIDESETTRDGGETADPLDELRRRYAKGEIDERELERGLDALLETEDVRTDDTDAIRAVLERRDRQDTPSRETEESGSPEAALDVE
ncbi:putative membrane protein [Halorhabdus sp. SVX81]|uniref:SHOCT domain-containing protein n=1 Tax=Halorhabdus sp. SVX81 TaxID=2978283 RepID=UPI0023DB66BC|nr:SHOCT domain-containing protein [Halorhabdus sp. SVX81]WEL16985.1 putative membrane protein [Halorhabdus sp. SVX81]